MGCSTGCRAPSGEHELFERLGEFVVTERLEQVRQVGIEVFAGTGRAMRRGSSLKFTPRTPRFVTFRASLSLPKEVRDWG